MDNPDTADLPASRVEQLACAKCGAVMDVSACEPFSEVACPACSQRNPVPMRLDNFLLLSLMGKGAMGAVYHGLDESLGRQVAIKVMQKKWGQDQQFVDNFLREARAAAALNHPNIVQVYSCGQMAGQPYIAMELVAGGRLDTLMAKSTEIHELQALQIAIHVAEGLKAAAEIGLVHGDIKPENIMFDRHGVAKVVDFGLARFMAQQDSGEIWGTPYYIAPEKARGQLVDQRSDIYSLGATLYHVLTGQPPFEGTTATEVVLARLKMPAPKVQDLRANVHQETSDLVARMLEADPFLRYPNYDSLLSDMRAALRAVKQGPVMTPSQKKKARKPVGVIIIIAVAALALLGGGLYGLLKPRKPDPPKPTVKYIKKLIGGRLVNVPVTDEPAAATNAVVAGAGTPAPNATPGAADTNAAAAGTAPAVPITLDPFTTNQSQQVAAILRDAKKGAADDIVARLQPVYDQFAPASTPRLWLRVFEGIAYRLDGREEDAWKYWTEVKNSPIPAVPAGQPNPDKLLAAMGAGLANPAAGTTSIRTEAALLPPWAKAVVSFCEGFQQLLAKEQAEATSALKAYAEDTNGVPEWAYGMQPLAQSLVAQLDSVTALQKEAADLREAGSTAEALRKVEEFAAGVDPLFAPFVAPMIPKLKRQVDKDAAVRKEAEDAQAHIAQAATEIARADGLRKANQAALVQAKDFRKLVQDLKTKQPEYQTVEGQQAFNNLLESYQRMADLKQFLLDVIPKVPFDKAPAQFGGTVISANQDGVRVALAGGRGDLVREWAWVTPKLYVGMCNHYILSVNLADKDRADKLLSLAVLCYHIGGRKIAADLLDKAAALDPDVRAKGLALMPDVLTPEVAPAAGAAPAL